MAVDKKFFVDINLQGNALNNATIGSNSDMTKGGSFQYNGTRLEYYNGSVVQLVANMNDISAVTGGLIFQGGYDPTTNIPNIADGTAKKGYFWVATAAGTFLGEAIQVGDSLIATVNDAGASIGDWLILQGNVVIATDTVDGIVRLATQAEVDAGTEGGAVVLTPATFAASSQLTAINNSIDALESDKLARDGSQAMEGNFDMGGNDITNINDIAAGSLSGIAGQNINLINNINASNTSTIINLPTPISGADAANKSYVDDNTTNKLPLLGGTMEGSINMGGNNISNANSITTDGLSGNGGNITLQSGINANGYSISSVGLSSAVLTNTLNADGNNITNLPTPTEPTAATNKQYVDNQDALKLSLTGGTMEGSLDMDGNTISAAEITDATLGSSLDANSNSIINLAEPTSAQDAATKSYVDTQLGAAVFSRTFVAADWTENGGVYTLQVTHNLNSDTPKVSAYVSLDLVEFAVRFSNANTIILASNIAPPASVNVGVSK
jgi:hypothetical protein